MDPDLKILNSFSQEQPCNSDTRPDKKIGMRFEDHAFNGTSERVGDLGLIQGGGVPGDHVEENKNLTDAITRMPLHSAQALRDDPGFGRRPLQSNGTYLPQP